MLFRHKRLRTSGNIRSRIFDLINIVAKRLAAVERKVLTIMPGAIKVN
jgi:hypothetical protein